MIFLKIFFSIWLVQKNTNSVKWNPATFTRRCRIPVNKIPVGISPVRPILPKSSLVWLESSINFQIPTNYDPPESSDVAGFQQKFLKFGCIG
jgi:hypothetical protein